MAEVEITPGGLDDPRVQAVLATHVDRARAETGRGSAHALDLGALRHPDIGFWTGWWGGEPVAVVALKRLGPGAGEVKSMYTAEAARGRGVGGAMLRHIIDVAGATGLARLSLETGAWDYFRPARALYTRQGFVECPPFDGYVEDPNSIFMTLALPPAAR